MTPSSPTALAEPTLSVRGLALPSAESRGQDLQVRVTAPATGTALPVVVFSHGFGCSMDSYGPLADHWAEQGFVVVQPTHLDAFALGLAPDDARTPTIWRHRITDLRSILDEVGRIEAAVPGLGGRIDRDRIAVAGHSYGATSVSALLGARVVGGVGDPDEDFSDPRVAAGVLLSLAGTGGDALTPLAAEHFPFMHPGFGTMTTRALVVAGDEDQSMLSVRGPEWFTEAYALSPGAESLLTLVGAEHRLGGIQKAVGMPESPADLAAHVALSQRVSTAYLRSALELDDTDWSTVKDELGAGVDPLARLESR